MSILFLFIIAVCLLAYAAKVSRKNKADSVKSQNVETSTHFDQLDDDGNPNKEDTPISVMSQPKVKVIFGSDDSDAPVQELEYFCIKDKGYHVTIWPKDVIQFDIVEFNIAGMSHRDNIDNYLGEFKGTLEAEPSNTYDPNAIKVLAHDGHHVGYVPKDMTAEIRKESTLPCSCFCYIGENDGAYFSCCYILRHD